MNTSEYPFEKHQYSNGLVLVHHRNLCAGRACCIHNPSNHHMVDWPKLWRQDRSLTERVCSHGVGHPDPDHLAYVRLVHGEAEAHLESIHGCDGCCARPAGRTLILSVTYELSPDEEILLDKAHKQGIIPFDVKDSKRLEQFLKNMVSDHIADEIEFLRHQIPDHGLEE